MFDFQRQKKAVQLVAVVRFILFVPFWIPFFNKPFLFTEGALKAASVQNHFSAFNV